MEVVSAAVEGEDSVKSDDGFVTTGNEIDNISGEASLPPRDIDPQVAKPVQPLIIDKAYAPTIFGLEAARTHCRFMMNRIVSEVSSLTHNHLKSAPISNE